MRVHAGRRIAIFRRERGSRSVQAITTPECGDRDAVFGHRAADLFNRDASFRSTGRRDIGIQLHTLREKIPI